jgi:vancomycin resistance protein YoaR
MAEKTKSATTTPKPRKTAAKKKAADTPSNVTEITVTREQMTINREISKEEIARLAHELWNERGRQHGRDADDWFQAEQLLRGKAS